MTINPKIKKMIVDQLGVEDNQVTPEASFVEDLKADSLDIVELVMSMEEAFDIEIPDQEAETLKTVGDVQSYLVEKNLLPQLTEQQKQIDQK